MTSVLNDYIQNTYKSKMLISFIQIGHLQSVTDWSNPGLQINSVTGAELYNDCKCSMHKTPLTYLPVKHCRVVSSSQSIINVDHYLTM